MGTAPTTRIMEGTGVSNDPLAVLGAQETLFLCTNIFGQLIQTLTLQHEAFVTELGGRQWI